MLKGKPVSETIEEEDRYFSGINEPEMLEIIQTKLTDFMEAEDGR